MAFNLQQLSDIAHALKAAHPTQDVAVAGDKDEPGTIRYALRAPRGKEPYSAVVKALQLAKDGGKKLRAPLVTTAAVTEMCKGMAGNSGVAVSTANQKSATPVVLPGGAAVNGAHTAVGKAIELTHPAWEDRDQDLKLFRVPDIQSPNIDVTKETRTDDHTGSHTIHRIYMMAAYALMASRRFGDQQLPSGKAVGALMVQPDGKIIGCGVNTNTKNGTFHAEVNCLQSYYREHKNGFSGLPKNVRIYSTLEPCEMCAGMIWETAEDTSQLLVYYGMVDPAQLARGTKLAEEKRERLLSHWQEVSYFTDKGSKVARPPSGPAEEKQRQGPKAIKFMIREQVEGPEAYRLIYTDYAKYLEQQKGGSQLSAADFMTGTKKEKQIPASVLQVNQSLLTKMTKYEVNPDKKPLNENVRKVVTHVRAFLKQMKIAGF